MGQSYRSCVQAGDREICSETQILEDPQASNSEMIDQIMAEQAAQRRNDPFALDSEHPMVIERAPESPGSDVETRWWEADAAVEDASLHVHGAVAESRSPGGEVQGTLGGFNGQAGAWNQDDGNWRMGATGQATLLGGQAGDQNNGGSGALGQLQGNAWFGSDGAAFGGQATMGQMGASTGDLSPETQDDDIVNFGAGEGAGFEVRGHWGDADNDHEREVGFGFDAGPISVDLATEDIVGAPGRLWDWMTGDDDD